MLDSLRAEFPGATGAVTRLRRPIVGREPVLWAFLSAAGAGFIVGGIVGLFLATGFPAFLPPTEPRPPWLTYANLTQTSAAFAIGAVAFRTGGLRALALYLAWSLLLVIAQLPGRQLSCERSGQFAGLDPDLRPACDLFGLIAQRWPIWLALALGALGSRWLLRTGNARPSLLLRGASVYAVVVALAGMSYSFLTIVTLSYRDSSTNVTLTAIYVAVQIVSGVLTGLVLQRASPAASVLVAVLMLSSLSLTLPLAIQNQSGSPSLPLEVQFIVWSGIAAPIVAAVCVLGARLTVRRARAGTTS